jgi:putative SOS response-associated peptidase YedK
MMQSLALGVPTQQSERDLPRSDDIRINDFGPVMRTAGNGVELAQMRFGFPPSNPRGGRFTLNDAPLMAIAGLWREG